MKEWKEYKLGELTDRKIGYGIVQPGENIQNGIPIIKVNNIISGLKDVSDLDRTSPDNDEKYKRTRLKGGEIIISIVGTIGKTTIVPKSFAGSNLVRATALIDIPDDNKTLWVKYYIDSPQGQTYIKENLNTTVQPTLNIKSLIDMPIRFYSTDYMNKATSILKSLDDKIEVNRRINEQLGELAQALFKSWFVDFEPFKDGEFVDSELGMIPKGWKVGTLGELIEIKYGKDHKKLSDGNIPVFGSGGIMRYVDKSLYEGESVLIPRKGTLNNVMYVNRDFWTVDTMFFTKMKVKDIAIFVYLFLSKKDLASMNSGSAVPSMTVEILNRIPLVIPSNNVFEDFNRIVSSLFSQMDNNIKEIHHLTTLRDTLLPKLMSGEIDVNEVEI